MFSSDKAVVNECGEEMSVLVMDCEKKRKKKVNGKAGGRMASGSKKRMGSGRYKKTKENKRTNRWRDLNPKRARGSAR